MNCPLCASESSVYHDTVWQRPGAKVWRCSGCALAFIHPAMTEAEERAFYADYNGHAAARGVSDATPEELHRKGLAVAGERLKAAGRLIEGIGTALEIGSATGAFIELASAEGAVFDAVEPDAVNRAYASRFARRVYPDMGSVPEGATYDMVCMFHVFEHIREPLPMLNACKARLKKGGRVLVEVPSLDDPLISLYGCRAFKDFYFQPMHPYVYSPGPLRLVFERAGFRVVECVFHQRYGLDNHLAWLAKGSPGGDAALREIFGPAEEYKASLERAGRTDTVFLLAEARDGVK